MNRSLNSDSYIESGLKILGSTLSGLPNIGSLFLGEGNNFDKNIVKIRKYTKKENDKKTIIAMKNIITWALNYINGKSTKLENNLPKNSSRNLINFNSTIEELLYGGADSKQLVELETFLKESLKDIQDKNINLDDVDETPAEKEEESYWDELLRAISASMWGNPRGLAEVNQKTKWPKMSKTAKENEKTEREILKDINKYSKDKEIIEDMEIIINDLLGYIEWEKEYRGWVPISDSVEATHLYRIFKWKIENFIYMNDGQTEQWKNKIIKFLNELKEELNKNKS